MAEIWRDTKFIMDRLTAVSGHVTENFQMLSIVRGVDPVLSVYVAYTFVPDVLTRLWCLSKKKIVTCAKIP